MIADIDIVPQQQLASGAVDFAISWVPKALVSREQGADIVNVAQVFQRFSKQSPQQNKETLSRCRWIHS